MYDNNEVNVFMNKIIHERLIEYEQQNSIWIKKLHNILAESDF